MKVPNNGRNNRTEIGNFAFFILGHDKITKVVKENQHYKHFIKRQNDDNETEREKRKLIDTELFPAQFTLFPDLESGVVPSGYNESKDSELIRLRFWLMKFVLHYKKSKMEEVSSKTMKSNIFGIQR